MAKVADFNFILKDASTEQAWQAMKQVLVKSGKTPGEDKNNAVLYSKGPDVYYIKFYSDNKHVNVFMAVEKSEKENFVQSLKSTGYKTFTLVDKDLQKKYRKDFNRYVNEHGITDVRLGKSDRQSGGYNPYTKPLNNLKLEEAVYEANGISIVRIKYRAKSEVQDYANGFEYIITNNNSRPVTLKEVGSSDFIPLTEIAKKVVGFNFSDIVPVYGLVRGVRTDIEKNKFTRPFPSNEVIDANLSLKILALAPLNTTPAAKFVFIIGNTERTIKF